MSANKTREKGDRGIGGDGEMKRKNAGVWTGLH
jgi:hypothetical protein